MKSLVGLMLVLMSIPGCALDAPEGEDGDEALSVAESESVIDTAVAMNYKSCEDHTTGGGQRVRGRVVIEPWEWTSTTTMWVATVSAENWKKNFGWNLKPTGQLRIVGTITLTDPHGSQQTINVDQDTGGSTVTRIGMHYGFAHVPSNTSWQSSKLNANVLFYGRDGTICGV